jgi:hypothetical protein
MTARFPAQFSTPPQMGPPAMSGSDYGTTSVPAPSFTDAGFVAPAESDMLTGVLADMNAAMGGNLNTGLSTPQGQLAMSLTAILGDAYDQMLAIFNGGGPIPCFRPHAGRDWQYLFHQSQGATATVVGVTCIGAAGTVVPEGTLIQDGSGNYLRGRWGNNAGCDRNGYGVILLHHQGADLLPGPQRVRLTSQSRR